jgi:hypothetical protein
MAIAAVGCFDVGTGKSPLLIDNFDNGSVLPIDHHFDQWRCGIFPSEDYQNCECGYDDGTFDSYPYSIFLQADVKDSLLITGSDHGGAQLYTQAVVPEDLSQKRQLVFSAKFDNSSSIPNSVFYVELHCSLASGSDASMTKDLQVHAQVPEPQTWNTFVMELSEFKIAYDPIPGGATACLEHVDSIHFSVNAQLGEGQTGSFRLNLDDIYFR